MFRVLIIDNYDSFTYNLVHYLEALDCEVTVIRNDKICDKTIKKFDKIIISPGPGLPEDNNMLSLFIKQYAPTNSILGICLGQQVIAEAFEGKLLALPNVNHGVTCGITHLENDVIYQNIPKNFKVGLYHSWHTINIKDDLIITAVSKDGIIMSIKHKKYNLRAIQYHPESIMTEYGKKILRNWVNN